MGLLNFTSKFPKVTIFIVLITTIFFGRQIQDLKIDSSIENLLIQTDEDYQYYLKTKDWFGSDNVTSIILRDSKLYTKEKLETLQNLVFEMETWKEIEKINSIFTSTHFENLDGTLQTVPLLDFIPKEDKEIKK